MNQNSPITLLLFAVCSLLISQKSFGQRPELLTLFKEWRAFEVPVTLDQIKTDPRLAEMVLVKNSRLSVQPVTEKEWQVICDLGKTEP